MAPRAADGRTARTAAARRQPRVGVGADTAVGLGALDQLGQVSRDRAEGFPGRLGQLGLGGQRGRVGEEHAVCGAGVLSASGPGTGIRRGLA